MQYYVSSSCMIQRFHGPTPHDVVTTVSLVTICYRSGRVSPCGAKASISGTPPASPHPSSGLDEVGHIDHMPVSPVDQQEEGDRY